LLKEPSEEGNRKALEHFQRAIDLDPTYAPAYAGLAYCHCTAGSLGYEPSYEVFPKAKAAAQRALGLDEGLTEAHAVLGTVMVMADWDWVGAERELRRALALDPNNSDAHALYGFYLVWVAGRADLAVTEYRRALELDPLPPGRTFGVGFALYYARRHDESIAQLKKALELNLKGLGASARMYLGLNYAHKKIYGEAVAECAKAVESGPEDQLVLGYCGSVYGLAGRRQEALALLDRLKSLSARHYVDPSYIAVLCDGLGDNDRTMEWLERAYTERSASSSGLRGELWTDKLRSDPRFQVLMRRMKYPASGSQ
jgi:tetratricopeptide (TPR) repeat protein